MPECRAQVSSLTGSAMNTLLHGRRLYSCISYISSYNNNFKCVCVYASLRVCVCDMAWFLYTRRFAHTYILQIVYYIFDSIREITFVGDEKTIGRRKLIWYFGYVCKTFTWLIVLHSEFSLFCVRSYDHSQDAVAPSSYVLLLYTHKVNITNQWHMGKWIYMHYKVLWNSFSNACHAN